MARTTSTRIPHMEDFERLKREHNEVYPSDARYSDIAKSRLKDESAIAYIANKRLIAIGGLQIYRDGKGAHAWVVLSPYVKIWQWAWLLSCAKSKIRWYLKNTSIAKIDALTNGNEKHERTLSYLGFDHIGVWNNYDLWRLGVVS